MRGVLEAKPVVRITERTSRVDGIVGHNEPLSGPLPHLLECTDHARVRNCPPPVTSRYAIDDVEAGDLRDRPTFAPSLGESDSHERDWQRSCHGVTASATSVPRFRMVPIVAVYVLSGRGFDHLPLTPPRRAGHREPKPPQHPRHDRRPRRRRRPPVPARHPLDRYSGGRRGVDAVDRPGDGRLRRAGRPEPVRGLRGCDGEAEPQSCGDGDAGDPSPRCHDATVPRRTDTHAGYWQLRRSRGRGLPDRSESMCWSAVGHSRRPCHNRGPSLRLPVEGDICSRGRSHKGSIPTGQWPVQPTTCSIWSPQRISTLRLNYWRVASSQTQSGTRSCWPT